MCGGVYCFRFVIFSSLFVSFFSFCKTGSNYERLKRPKVSPAPVGSTGAPATKTFWIRLFTFAEIGDRTEMFRKAFVIPGYKGIDFDTYGRMDPSDQKTGMKTLYSIPDVHQQVAKALGKLDISAVSDENAAPEISHTVDVRVLGSESSMRMHTYGCWPIVGTVVYLFNADIYTVVTRTQIEYTIAGTAGNPQVGKLEIYSEMDFSFWGTYMGFDIYESFEAAQTGHIADIAGQLATLLSL